VPESLNLHRRHAAGLTIGSDQRLHMLEVLRAQQLVSQRYHPDPEVQRNMLAYVDHLRRQFALDETEVERLMNQTIAGDSVTLR